MGAVVGAEILRTFVEVGQGMDLQLRDSAELGDELRSEC